MADNETRELLRRALERHRAGNLADAEAIYRRILDADPAEPHALHLLGAVEHARGNDSEAERLIAASIAAIPRNAAALSNHGVVLRALGRSAEALARYDQALAIKPDSADTHYNRGVLLREQGELTGALASYDRALAIDDHHADALYNRGNALLALGRADDAVASYRKVLAVRSDDAAVLCNLADGLRALGRLQQAGDCYLRAIGLSPDHVPSWIGFSEFLSQSDVLDERLQPYVLAALRNPDLDPETVQPAAAALIARDPFMKELLSLCAEPDGGERLSALLAAGTLRPLFEMPLLLAVLEEGILTGFDLERLLTVLRSAILVRTAADPNAPPAWTAKFLSALALQGFANEYVWIVSDEEAAVVESLIIRIGDAIGRGDVPRHWVAMVAAYGPLHHLPYADVLERSLSDDPQLSAVVRRQISEPREERRIRDMIPSLTPVMDVVSTAVREQYERSPYPRWCRRRIAANARPLHVFVRELFPQQAIASHAGTTEVLVAGCGTGSHPLQLARSIRGAGILAVDLSRSSLCYAKRMTDTAGVPNVEYAQADILGFAGLDRRFDLVDATGVLHHMGDPLAGWAILRGLVRPGGFMKIGLYSRMARRNLIRLRDIISARGLPPSAEAIRAFRQEVMTGALRPLIERFDGIDFCSLSACRDLLFHVQEHVFTVPEIASALERFGLEFLGFEFRNPAHHRRYRRRFPDDVAAADLRNWATFEQEFPDTFVGMYQFWCRG